MIKKIFLSLLLLIYISFMCSTAFADVSNLTPRPNNFPSSINSASLDNPPLPDSPPPLPDKDFIPTILVDSSNVSFNNAKKEGELSSSSTPNNSPAIKLPPPPPVTLQNNIVQNKIIRNPKDQSAHDKLVQEANIEKAIYEQNQKLEEEAKIKDQHRRRNGEDFIIRLMGINYKNQVPPKKLYERPYSPTNLHLPPVYFKSYYLYLAFNAAAKDDLKGLNAVLNRYNLLNGQNKDGDTVLMYAIQNNSINSARLLLAKGAYVDAVNHRRRTALHYAAALGNKELTKLLLSMGSDYTLKDDNDMTAVDYAYSSNNAEVAKIIEKYIEQNKKQ